MAQLGSALHWGCRGRGFKSRRSDHFFRRATALSVAAVGFSGPLPGPRPVPLPRRRVHFVGVTVPSSVYQPRIPNPCSPPGIGPLPRDAYRTRNCRTGARLPSGREFFPFHALTFTSIRHDGPPPGPEATQARGPAFATIRPEITFSRPQCGHFFPSCCPRSRRPSRPRSGPAGRRTGKGRCDRTGAPGVGKP